MTRLSTEHLRRGREVSRQRAALGSSALPFPAPPGPPGTVLALVPAAVSETKVKSTILWGDAGCSSCPNSSLASLPADLRIPAARQRNAKKCWKAACAASQGTQENISQEKASSDTPLKRVLQLPAICSLCQLFLRHPSPALLHLTAPYPGKHFTYRAMFWR